MFRIRPLEMSDISAVVAGWNQVLIYDRVNKRKFEDVIFGDPNYERDCSLVAVDDSRIVGFIGAASRERILGKDGEGRPS